MLSTLVGAQSPRQCSECPARSSNNRRTTVGSSIRPACRSKSLGRNPSR